jgi:hypothetical protein
MSLSSPFDLDLFPVSDPVFEVLSDLLFDLLLIAGSGELEFILLLLLRPPAALAGAPLSSLARETLSSSSSRVTAFSFKSA